MNHVVNEYQEAVRVNDADPNKQNEERLFSARVAMQEFTRNNVRERRKTMNEVEKLDSHDEVSLNEVEKEISSFGELDAVKQQLKAALMVVDGLRKEYKHLDSLVKQNRVERRKYNRDVIPALRAKKKSLKLKVK